LRDYGITSSIWDGDPTCEHKFVNKVIKHDNLRFRCGSNTNVGNYKNPEIYSNHKVNNIFCSKCGAWRGQLGLEPDFELYIKHLINIFDEVKRVLKKTGTCWVNIGDTYSGSCQGAGKNLHSRLLNKKTENLGSVQKYILKYGHTLTQRPPSAKTSVPAKSLCQIPSRFAIAMADRGWVLRNELIWWKPNCIPSSVKDRFTVDFEKVFFFVKNRKYYFEQQFEEYTEPMNRWGGDVLKAHGTSTWDKGTGQNVYRNRNMRPNLQGRNKRCIWKIPTRAIKEYHFAIYPEKLVETPIKAGCPQYICKKCGKAKQKIYINTSGGFNYRVRDAGKKHQQCPQFKATEEEITKYKENEPNHHIQAVYAEKWISCDCKVGFKPGIVLDPFCGSGTTCLVAKKLGRSYIGIDINPEYIKIAKRRLATKIETRKC